MADEKDDSTSDTWAPWRRRISAARKRREERIGAWQENVKKRVKSADTGTTTETEASVNQDWPLTKAKIAQLYSTTPEVRLSPKPNFPQAQAAIAAFGRELNDTVTEINVGATIEEVASDVVNAAGIGGVIVTCDKRTETREVPAQDPMIAGMSGQPPQMIPVEAVVDIQYRVDRISPADLLIPTDFTGSDYDKARWLGHDDRMTWSQAQVAFGLTDEQKDEVLGKDARVSNMRSLNTDTNQFRDTEVVNYTQIFSWRHFYDPEETNFHALQRVVFVDGLDEPVIDEPYAVQTRLENGIIAGVRKNPIRISTLTYISDESLPPSDSSVARHNVTELEQSRADMAKQRKHSIPIRWGDVNRVSAGMKSQLDRGEYQNIVWTNGPGDRALGEVARAAFPPEKFEIDRIIKDEITEIYQVGTNQAGAFASGERSAREAGIVEKNFQRRVGQEQDKVSKFFLGIVEVLAAHIAMYGSFDLPDELGPIRQQLANAFTYSVRVDATVRHDADEQIERLTRGLNLTAQSGYVNPKPVIAKIWELLGEDPSTIVIDPQPKAPEPVKVSIGSAEDANDPVMLSLLMRTGQAGSPEDLAASIKQIRSVLQGMLTGQIPINPAAQEPSDQPQGGVENPGIAHPGWESAPRVERRAEDGGA